jgi:hypothetical protein
MTTTKKRETTDELLGTTASVVAVADQAQAGEATEEDIVDAPFGGSRGGSTGVRLQTFVSAVNAGAHLNIYLSDELLELARQWRRVLVRWHRKAGKPDVIHLRQSPSGYSPRAKGGQRLHFTIPTASVGKASGSIKPVACDAWVEGDEICVNVTALFAGEQRS